MIVHDGTKEESMVRGKGKMGDVDVEKKGDWCSSAGGRRKEEWRERRGGQMGVREGKGKEAWSEGKEEWGAEMDGGEEIGCLVLIACAKSIVAD